MLKTALVTARAVLFYPQNKLPLFDKKKLCNPIFFAPSQPHFLCTFSKKKCPFARFLKKAGRAKTLFSHLRNPIFFAPFRKKVPKTFQPKLRFGEFDSMILSRVWFDCEVLLRFISRVWLSATITQNNNGSSL